jgi:hypothetical protein
MTESTPFDDPVRDALIARISPITLPQSFMRALEQVHTAMQAMEIVLHGNDLDRAVLPPDTPDELVRRRWAAQLVILSNMFWNLERQLAELDAEVAKLPKVSNAP